MPAVPFFSTEWHQMISQSIIESIVFHAVCGLQKMGMASV